MSRGTVGGVRNEPSASRIVSKQCPNHLAVVEVDVGAITNFQGLIAFHLSTLRITSSFRFSRVKCFRNQAFKFCPTAFQICSSQNQKAYVCFPNAHPHVLSDGLPTLQNHEKSMQTFKPAFSKVGSKYFTHPIFSLWLYEIKTSYLKSSAMSTCPLYQTTFNL